jgi:hypothetical protein
MNSGFIYLHRKLKDHWIWKNPFYFQWFVYFLFRANFKANKVLIGSDLIDVKKGEFITSIEKLSKDLNGATSQKVRTFLKLLEKDKMIIKKSTSKLTKIYICNYDSYQTNQQANNKQITNQQQTNNKPTTTENKDKESKIKNNNINYIEIKDIFNSVCFKLPKIKKITQVRKKAIDNRVKEYSLIDIGNVFKLVAESDFLNGKNKNNWIASFDWILKPANFIKILEGNYKNLKDESRTQKINDLAEITAKNFGKEE